METYASRVVDRVEQRDGGRIDSDLRNAFSSEGARGFIALGQKRGDFAEAAAIQNLVTEKRGVNRLPSFSLNFSSSNRAVPKA